MNELLFKPFPTLNTNRLLLRQLVADDVENIRILRSDERILKYLLINKCNSLDEAREFINRINTNIENNESIYWGISIKNENKIIGTFCIWHITEENSRAEIGYVLHPQWQGKGFMNEALKAVLNYGFEILDLHSLEANVDPANTASIKLLEKNGFVKEAHFKENIFHGQRFIDTAIYSIINPLHR